jgi:hypothetical protein
MRAAVQTAPLKDVLASGETLVERVMTSLQNHPTITGLGLELLGLSVLAVKPKPETAKALEAEAARPSSGERMKPSMRAATPPSSMSAPSRRTRSRRNVRCASAGPRSSGSKWTPISISRSRRGRWSHSRRPMRAKRPMSGPIALAAVIKSIGATDPKVLQTLASVGMDPHRLMAAAFRDLADNAAKIGHLNITPDLLQELLQPQAAES